MTIQINPLQPVDRPAWEELARGYKAFYKTEATDAEYERAWHRLITQDGVLGLGDRHQADEARLVGIQGFNKARGLRRLPGVVLHDVAHQDVGIEASHRAAAPRMLIEIEVTAFRREA